MGIASLGARSTIIQDLLFDHRLVHNSPLWKAKTKACLPCAILTLCRPRSVETGEREKKREREREGEGRKREGEREREGRRSDAPQVSAHSRGRACANAGGTKHDVRTVVSLSSRRMESLESYPTLSALPPLSPSEMPACKHVRKGVPSNKKTKVPITQTAQQILH